MRRWRSSAAARTVLMLQDRVVLQESRPAPDTLSPSSPIPSPHPTHRLSAQGALRHPWFDTSPLARLGSAFGDLTQRVSQATTGLGGQWLGEVMARSGTAASGGFTEAQLSEELEEDGEVWQAPPKVCACGAEGWRAL